MNNIQSSDSPELASVLAGDRTSPIHTNFSISRRNSLVSNPHSYTSPGYSTSCLRRSATSQDRPGGQELARAGSFSRNSSNLYNHDISEPQSLYSDIPTGHGYTREGSVTPNYSRYSSLLDDKHDWGFRTLRRRNSKAGLSKIFPSDDIRF